MEALSKKVFRNTSMTLFKKNMFSVSEPKFSEINPESTKTLTEIINRNYPDLILKKIFNIGAFEINSNNWKVETDKGTYIFKRSDISKINALTAQAEIAHNLTKQKFPTIEFVKNADGKLISNDGDYVYCLTHFKNGNYFGSSIEEWKSLVFHLKSLFDYSSANKNIHSSALPCRTFFTEEENILIEKLYRGFKSEHITEKELLSLIKEYEQLHLNYHEISIPINTGIFHVDIHPHNLIFENNKLILLTDFEGFQLTNLKVSLGFGLYKCMRQLLTLVNSTNRNDLIHQMNGEFQKSFDLSLKELLIYGKIDVIKRILYILKELVEKGESKWLFVLETQLVSINEINEIVKII
jgi:hypothetical protein